MNKVTLGYNFGDGSKDAGHSSDVPDVSEALFLAYTLEENGDRPLGVTEDGVYIYNTAELAAATERLRRHISRGLAPADAARRVAAEDGHDEAEAAGPAGPDPRGPQSQ